MRACFYKNNFATKRITMLHVSRANVTANYILALVVRLPWFAQAGTATDTDTF